MTSHRIIALTAAMLLASAGQAVKPHTDKDWPLIKAEIEAMPADGAMPVAVAAILAQHETPPKGVPRKFKIYYVTECCGMKFVSGERDGAGNVTLQGDVFLKGRFDPLGIVALDHDSTGGGAMVSALTIDGDIDLHSPGQWQWNARYRPGRYRLDYIEAGSDNPFIENDNCAAVAADNKTITINCTQQWKFIRVNDLCLACSNKDTAWTETTKHYTLTYRDRFGLFLPKDNADETSIVDWQLDDGSWYSQTASAHLTADKREQARALFARGFDAYKAGDFAGATALVEAGMKIDPANHLGWFTRGEIERSALANGDSHAAKWSEAAYYQHVIELTPDSPEAILAAGYLKTLR